MREFLVWILPDFVKPYLKRFLKAKREIELKNQQKLGNCHSFEQITKQLNELGINDGDNVLVHTKMSTIGYVKGGANTVLNALLHCLNAPQKGTLLMPTFPNKTTAKEYFESNPVFDIKNTPSSMGKITELLRVTPGVVRSFHPTHPVVAYGPLADYFTSGHEGEITPFNKNSPFYRISEYNGKILLLGLRMSEALTNLHVSEDLIENFKFPVYDKEIVTAKMINGCGDFLTVQTKIHNPTYSNKRRCDSLYNLFKSTNTIIKEGHVGDAKCIVIDAQRLHAEMIEAYHSKGITMYTPKGS